MNESTKTQPPPERPCLYCKTLQYAKTREHVVLKAFGANLTLSDDVCEDCNTRVFAPLDKVLTDLLCNFVSGTPMARTLGFLQAEPHLHFDSESGKWLSMRVEADGTPVFYPQLVASSRNTMQFTFSGSTVEEAKAMLGRFRTELADPGTTFSTKLTHAPDSTRPEPQPALVRSSRGRYFVRACSTAAADELLQAVRHPEFIEQLANDANFQIDADSVHFKKTEQPEAHARLHFDFGSIERSLVKMALNTVCVVDPAAARHVAFAPARRYATHGPIDGTCEFVHHEWMKDAPAATALVAREGTHALILHHLVDDAGPAVSLSLFGKPIATVFLQGKERPQHLESPIGVGTFVVWEFDPSTRSHRVWMSMIDYVHSRITESGSIWGAAALER